MKFSLMVLVAVLVFADSHVSTASSSNSVEKNFAVNTSRQDAQIQFVLQRKERIQKVLVTLDHIAQLAAQMKPETADRVEPVIVDLAEQAIELANERALRANETEASLKKIELTVSQLSHTIDRYVEPEASL